MSENNGNGKVFELARPKSPEEIAEETALSALPKLRRACSKDPRLKRHVGAKWLFDKITDDSCMDCFGGNRRGKLWTTLKELRRRYGHDEETISSWAKKLEEAGWIWIQRGWPVWCFAVSGITQQPDLFSPEHARIQARASKTLSDGFVQENHETLKIGLNNHDSRPSKPSVTVNETVSDGQTDRQSRFHQPSVTANPAGESRFHQPSVTDGLTVSDGQKNRQSPDSSTVSDGANKETPGRNGVLEAKECVPAGSARAVSHSPIPRYEALDQKMVPRLRPKWGSEAIERIKEKIFAMEGSRRPLPNQKEIIAIHKQRIRDIKDWMNGEIPAEQKSTAGTAAR